MKTPRVEDVTGPDFVIEVHGFECVVAPRTPAGRDWFTERLGGGTWVRMEMGPEFDELLRMITSTGVTIANTGAGLH